VYHDDSPRNQRCNGSRHRVDELPWESLAYKITGSFKELTSPQLSARTDFHVGGSSVISVIYRGKTIVCTSRSERAGPVVARGYYHFNYVNWGFAPLLFLSRTDEIRDLLQAKIPDRNSTLLLEKNESYVWVF